MEITELKELAGRPRPGVDGGDVPLESIEALEELYASVNYSTDEAYGGRDAGGREEHPAGVKVPVGSRNNYLTRLAGAMRRVGTKEGAIFAALWVVNAEEFELPLPEDEVRGIAQGIQRYAPADTSYRASTTPPFPLAALPPSLGRLVREAATSIGCPPDFIGVPMLVTLGAAIGNSYELKVKEGWFESPTLYGAVVADPGDKKTPALKVATAPARRRQAALKREYDEEMRDYYAEKRQWEVDKKCARDNNEPAPPEPEEPTMRRVTVNDVTVEALADILEANRRGVLCKRDELSGWLRSMDQYKGGKGADRQQWLELWNNDDIIVDRRGRKQPLVVPRAFTGVVGTIQPKILPELSKGSEDGLPDRFLHAYPDPMPSRWSDEEISREASDDYQELYDRLCDLEMGMDEYGEPNPKRLRLTANARNAFIDEVNSLREEMEHPEFPEYLKSPWSKLEAYLGRLTLIMALVRIVEEGGPVEGPRGHSATRDDVKVAADLLAYFKAHARKVHAMLHGEKPQNLLSVALKGFLREQGGTWEGTTDKLYGIFESRSAPGLPGGSVPFGKMIRQIARQDYDLTFEQGHRGSRPIIKLSLSNRNTAAHEGNVDADAESTEGTDSTEGKSEAEHAGTDSGDTAGSSTGSGSFSQDSNLGDSGDPVWTDADDNVETEVDQEWVSKVERVLRRHVAEYVTADPSFLIAEGVFRELDRDPTPGEVEEAQCRILGVED